ncbi:MAG: LPS assembly lipoprotein LptE [Planctomycetota bacterium]
MNNSASVKGVLLVLCLPALSMFLCLGPAGCSMKGYSNEWLHTTEISTIYVEMFDTSSFRRGQEYELTDALAKRIEAETPYKIVTDRSRADSIISGELSSIGGTVLSAERETGRSLEKGLQLEAVVIWKNLKTGEILIDNKKATASASHSEWLDQGEAYAMTLAVNRLADRIVQMMEKEW